MEVDRLQPIFDIETRTGLLDPGEVSVTFSKITLSLFTIKEGSTAFSKPFSPQGTRDVAGDAIALPEFLYRQRSLCPQGAADDFLRNKVAIVCAVLHRLAESLLAVMTLIYAWFALKLEKNVGNVRGNVYLCELKFVKRLKKKENYGTAFSYN